MKKLRKKLQRQFDGKFSVTAEKDCVILHGESDDWDEIVQAGYLCTDKRRKRYVVNDIVYTAAADQKNRHVQLKDSTLDGFCPDVLIIGSGVIGCAAARELSRRRLKILLIDKEHDVAMHASSRNDGAVHPGIDLKRGQVKRSYNLRGNAMYDKLCRELHVKFVRSGQTVGFTQNWLRLIMPIAMLRWRLLGVPCRFLNAAELRRAEPHFSADVRFAIFFPTGGIVSPYELTVALAENAADNGVKISLDTEALSMETKDGIIESVVTNRGTVRPRVVINAAGVFSEEVAAMAHDRFFSIHPRKGTDLILDKKSAYKVNSAVSSINTKTLLQGHSKGGGVMRTVDGNVLIGPDAEEIYRKDDFSTDRKRADAILKKQQNAIPDIGRGDIITYFSGVRAASYEEDFIICRGKTVSNLIHAAGIQSPGLTAAPAIGVDLAEMAEAILSLTQCINDNPDFDPERIPIPCTRDMPKDERDRLIRSKPDYGIIICRCEEISKGEILDAMRRSVPCDTLDGIKRRVRPGMGRCQSGFCGPLVAEMIAAEKQKKLSEINKSGIGSNLLYRPTKEGSADEI